MSNITLKSPPLWLGVFLFIAPLAKGLYYEQDLFLFLLGLVMVFSIYWLRQRPFDRWLYYPLDFGLAAFVLAYFLSIPGAADIREAVVGLLRAIGYILFYWLVTRHVRDLPNLKRLFWAIYLSSLASLALSFLVASGWLTMPTVYEAGILQTTLQYKNAGALFIAIASILGLFLYSGISDPRTRLTMAAGQYLLLTGLIGTMSRGVWLLYPLALLVLLPGWPAPTRNKALGLLVITSIPALAVQDLIYSAFNNAQPISAWLWLVLGTGLTLILSYGLEKFPHLPAAVSNRRFLAMLGLLALGAILIRLNSGSGLVARIKEISFTSYSVQERLYLYKDAWKIITSHPFFGAGARGWDALYLNIQSYAYYAENVHNDYLQLLVETGFFGLLAFLLIWALFLLTLRRKLKSADDETRRLLWTAGVAAVFMGVHSILDFDLAHSALALLLWTFLAVPTALDKPKILTLRPLLRNIYPVVLILFLITISSISVSFYIGNNLFAKGEETLNQGDLPATREYFRQALTFDPYKTNTVVSLAQINLALAEGNDQAALEEALTYARKAVDLRPAEPLSHFVLATALYYRGEAEEGAKELEAYVNKQPNLLKTYEELAKGYNQAGKYFLSQGNPGKAAYYFRKTLTVPQLLSGQQSRIEPGALSLWVAEPKLDTSEEIPKLVEEAKNQLSQLGQ